MGWPFAAGSLEPAPIPPGWNIAGSLGGYLMGTDNVGASAQNKKADLITAINPVVRVTADTARVKGLITYSPIAQFFAFSDNQNRVDHFYNGRVLADLIPETLYLDLRGFGGTQTFSGGFAPQGSPVVDRRNRVQTAAFQVSPYFVHRFGTLGTLQVGYAFQYVDQGVGGTGVGNSSASGLPHQYFNAHQVYATARTGEDFGRLALQARVSGTTYTGTGVLDDARRNIALLETRYAITRNVAALVEGGWEEQRYTALVPGQPDFKINEPVWGFGARLTPGRSSVITAGYRRRDGFNSPFADAAAELSPRIRFFGRYQEVLTTSALTTADLLSATTVDALGNTVDSQTGAPVAPSTINNSLLAFTTGLRRVKRGVASISQLWPRDTLTLSVIYEDQRPVSGAFNVVNAFSQRVVSGTVSWVHEFAPDTRIFSYVQYGRTHERLTGTDSDIFSFSTMLEHMINPTLTATFQYFLTNREAVAGSGGTNLDQRAALQNVVIVGLRQAF